MSLDARIQVGTKEYQSLQAGPSPISPRPD